MAMVTGDVSFMGWVLILLITQSKFSLRVLYLGGVQSESPYLRYRDCTYMSLLNLGVQLDQTILIMTPRQYCGHIITQVH